MLLQRPPVAGPGSTGISARLPEVLDALPATSFQWEEHHDDKLYDPLFLNVDGDERGEFAISVFVDTHRFSPAGVEACVRGMESVAVATACDPAAPTRVASGT